jgi:hypothetical protein
VARAHRQRTAEQVERGELDERWCGRALGAVYGLALVVGEAPAALVMELCFDGRDVVLRPLPGGAP